jgi:hypothetical protein
VAQLAHHAALADQLATQLGVAGLVHRASARVSQPDSKPGLEAMPASGAIQRRGIRASANRSRRLVSKSG